MGCAHGWVVDPGIRMRQAELAAPPGFEDAIAWLAETNAEETPHWRVTFTVADRDQTLTEAEWFGSPILRQNDTVWTRSALIRDPQGA